MSTTLGPAPSPGAPDALTETEPEVFQARPSARRALQWRSAWRWHFYASLIVLPILFVLSVSGLFILLKPTLERTFYGDRLYVDTGTSRVPYAEQVEAVQEAYPGAKVSSVVPPRHAERSTQFDLTTSAGEAVSVYVNPYTGKVLGNIHSDTRLDSWMSRLHGELLLGKKGDWLVEIGAGWALVMAATGLYLWWPRFDKGQTWKRAFVPRWRARGRKRVRDFHAIPGAVFAVVLVFFVVTGLPWSGFWGDRFTRFADWVGQGANNPTDPPTSVALGDLRTDGLSITWAVAREGVPASRPASPRGVARRPARSPLDLEQVERIGQKVGMEPGFGIGLPAGPAGVFTLSNAWPGKAQQAKTVSVDQYSGEVLATHGWKQQGALKKATSWGVDTHMGTQYGKLNAIVMGGACVAFIIGIVTAPIMYWKRRPKGKLGTPRRPVDAKVPRGALAVAAGLAVIYPLLGLSMIAVGLLDRFVIRRIRPLRRAFGMP